MSLRTAAHAAPHLDIPAGSEKERFTLKLFDDLWARYIRRVSHVRTYEEIVARHGGKFVNDHIAFRTIAWPDPATGIFTLARIFKALGFSPAACYEFPDKHLGAIHMEHPNPKFPKLFISELKTWEIPKPARAILARSLKTHRLGLSPEDLARLYQIDGASARDRAGLLSRVIRVFNHLPWNTPRKADVLALDKASQYGAWVLLNGYEVNHFTASVNSHGVAALDSIDKTIAALKNAGVPMKKEIEGDPGSLLRQSSTEAVKLSFRVRGNRGPETLEWTYAYFEIAERGYATDARTGARNRFEGFLGAQAAQLFDMTKV
ncbi:DUF1338 domain-containing protein [bacterium]|nr:DUF1338 domain-containing protein [bacterium]